MSLECLAQEAGGPLPPINGLGGQFVKPVGFVMVNVQVPCVKGYNEDQIAIIEMLQEHCRDQKAFSGTQIDPYSPE